MRRRSRFPWVLLLAGGVVAGVLLATALGLYTRTEWGHRRVLALTLRTLGGRLNGKLHVNRLAGDLMRGARLYGITLADARGVVLLSADSAYLDYRLPTLIGGDIAITRLDLYHADVHLFRVPGDSLWNYQHVLLDTTSVKEGPGRATLIDRLRLVDGDVRVRLPWEPDRRLTPRQQRRDIRDALSDTSELMVQRVPGGLMRTMTFRVDTADVRSLVIAPDERGGTYLQVAGGTGRAQLYRGQPLRIRSVRGELAQRDGVVTYSAPFVALPSSDLATAGTVDLRGEEPRYDVKATGRNVALRDLQWLYKRFPSRGNADFQLWLETRPQGTLFRFAGLRVNAPGTRITGRFGMLVGDTVVFSDVSLRGQPIDMNTIQRMLPTEIPVRGLHIGSAEIRTPGS